MERHIAREDHFFRRHQNTYITWRVSRPIHFGDYRQVAQIDPILLIESDIKVDQIRVFCELLCIFTHPRKTIKASLINLMLRIGMTNQCRSL